jgi:hypothetical protein
VDSKTSSLQQNFNTFPNVDFRFPSLPPNVKTFAYVGFTTSSLTPNVEVKWLASLDLYLGILGSYLGPVTGHLEVFNTSLEFEDSVRLVH